MFKFKRMVNALPSRFGYEISYDPQKCINAWMSCLRVGGLCILEHSSAHGPQATSVSDPFGADLVQMPYLILLFKTFSM